MIRKVLFLTGGSRGIGKSIKDHFEKNSWKVISPTRKELDLGVHDSVKDYMKNINFIPDVIINNGGISFVEDLLDFSRENFLKIMDTNFISHVYITKEFLKKSKCENKEISIINISSIRTYEIKRGRMYYSLSKLCLEMLTKYIIHEIGDSRVRCNNILPGHISTDMLVKNNDNEKLKKMLNSIPAERFCSPSELSKTIFQISVNNKYINGQNIIIDGGKSCK